MKYFEIRMWKVKASKKNTEQQTKSVKYQTLDNLSDKKLQMLNWHLKCETCYPKSKMWDTTHWLLFSHSVIHSR